MDRYSRKKRNDETLVDRYSTVEGRGMMRLRWRVGRGITRHIWNREYEKE